MTERLSKASRLKDVAARARVSTATVSRVLNGLGPTSEDVRGRVFRAAKELDYHPNWLARSLRARQTNTIGVVLPDIENPFFTSLVKGAERAAGLCGWNLILGNSDEDVMREEALECLGETPRPRAIFAFNNLMAEAALLAIRDRGLRCPEDVALIGFDDFRSAAAMTPPLTVVEQDPVGMGEKAVEVLGDVVASGTPAVAETVLPTRLVLRASCGCGNGQG